MGYLGLSKRKLSQKERASRLMAKAEFREFKESRFPVSAREYVRFRLSKTLTEFRNKHNELMVYSLMAQVFMYVLSALGSVLATIGMPEWVAITVALGQASQQWLRQNRVEERRIAYRQAAAEMADARMKWEAIPMEKTRDSRKYRRAGVSRGEGDFKCRGALADAGELPEPGELGSRGHEADS
jgi:hypothetical protein